MSGPIAHGDTSIKEQPGSPEIRLTAEGKILTRIYRGPYAALASFAPQYGADVTGYPGFKVREWTLRNDGALATLTIIADNISDSLTEYEVDWVEIQKDLYTHPRYNDGGAKPLTDEDRAAIEIWKTEPSWTLRKAFKFKDGDQTKELSANAKDFAKKILAGTDSYVVYAPVVRKRSYSLLRPGTAKCGFRDEPPSASGRPPGYQWLKTGDRRFFNGRRWERFEEWTGADRIDHEIYPDS